MKSLKTIITKKELIEKLNDYFRNTEYSISDITQLGSRLFVSLYYEDFRPATVVRAEIEKMADNISVDRLERTFSPYAHILAWYGTDEPDGTLFVKMPDGSFQETCVAWVIEERLRDTNFEEIC